MALVHAESRSERARVLAYMAYPSRSAAFAPVDAAMVHELFDECESGAATLLHLRQLEDEGKLAACKVGVLFVGVRNKCIHHVKFERS